MATGILHAIHNPLTAVSSYSQLLGLGLPGPKVVECASRIREGIGQIQRILRSLSSFGRPSEESFYPLDLNQIVQDTLSFGGYELIQREARLVQDLQPGLPRVMGVKDQLEHLLLILFTNARDALAGRGTITVRTAAADAAVVLVVEDDGVGMSESERERMFEPFFTTKPEGKGTGLGLFIAAGIAQRHQAKIRAESAAGRGTRVSVSLPAFGS
jgi:signal transduction histidine kinase